MAPLSDIWQLDFGLNHHTLERRGIGHDLKTKCLAELVLPLVATICVATRVYVRCSNKFSMGWDDWIICLSLLFAWGLWAAWWHCSVNVVQTTISTMPPDRYSDFLKISFIEEFIYVNGCNVVKISILFFYLRAMGTTRAIRIGIYTLMAFTGAYTIARFFSTLFECIPISFFWNRNQPGHCIDYYKLILTLQIINVILDFAILLFPIPIISSLTMPMRRKIGLCLIFCVGAVACTGSAVRIWLVVLVFGGDATSLFHDDVTPKLVLSAMSELNFGIMAASLPALRAPVWNMFGKIFGGSGNKNAEARNSDSNLPGSPARAQSPRNSRAKKGIYDVTLTTTSTDTDYVQEQKDEAIYMSGPSVHNGENGDLNDDNNV